LRCHGAAARGASAGGRWGGPHARTDRASGCEEKPYASYSVGVVCERVRCGQCIVFPHRDTWRAAASVFKHTSEARSTIAWASGSWRSFPGGSWQACRVGLSPPWWQVPTEQFALGGNAIGGSSLLLVIPRKSSFTVGNYSVLTFRPGGLFPTHMSTLVRVGSTVLYFQSK
jgi:hypothetical protein